MKRLLVLMAVFVSVTLAYLKAYEVTPTQASWSGKASGEQNYGVGEWFTANFDSICWCDVFVGDTGQSHAAVKVDIYEYPNGVTPIAYNDGVAQTRSHIWLNLPLTTASGQKFTRGKEYVPKVTRPNVGLDFQNRGLTIQQRS